MSDHADDLLGAAAVGVVAALGSARARELAALLAHDHGPERTLAALKDAAATEAVMALFDAARRTGTSGPEAGAYLRGFVAGSTTDRAEATPFWSGPASPAVPSRAAAQVLVEVVDGARRELLAMTYSARPYVPLTAALGRAVARGVEVHIAVETLEGAGGLLSGAEPAQAFASVPGVAVWSWPKERRDDGNGRLHAKLAVADRTVLWLGSANLTESGVRRNLEAGLRIKGGSAPGRVAEHIRDLQRRGVLERVGEG